MIEVKLTALGLVLASAAQFVDSAVSAFILAGAIATAFLAIGSLARRAYRFISKVDQGVDLLFHLDGRFDGVDQRLDTVERRVDGLEREQRVLRLQPRRT